MYVCLCVCMYAQGLTNSSSAITERGRDLSPLNPKAQAHREEERNRQGLLALSALPRQTIKYGML
jgi:hypothetical protein